MADYTPTTASVKNTYASFWERRYDSAAWYAECEGEFDRWLKAEKAKWQAEMVADLRAKFGVTNRAADYLARKGSDDGR